MSAHLQTHFKGLGLAAIQLGAARFVHSVDALWLEHEMVFDLRVRNECDGMLVGTPSCYERPEMLHGMSEWFRRSGRDVYPIGPIISTTEHAQSTEKIQSSAARDIDAFLARILASHGPASLLYVGHLLCVGNLVKCLSASRFHLGLSCGRLSPRRSGRFWMWFWSEGYLS